MMHVRGLVLMLLFLPGDARRTIRIDDSRHGAEKHNTLANGLQVSAESREALIPGEVGTGLSRRAGPQAVDLRDGSNPDGQRAGHPQMINLFGNTEESQKRRQALSLRDAQAGDRKVTFRKPNTAASALLLGIKFREGFGKAVFIDKIIPGTEAGRLKQQGKIKEGDEVTMVSATFGDEMWSTRGAGKTRLEKSIAVRQGMTISFVLEQPGGSRKQTQQQQKKERDRMTRMQKQLLDEVQTEQNKGWFR